MTLVDFYGTSFVVFILASFEIIGFVWVYGFENFLDDLEFMLEKQPSVYWRMCWFIITPFILITIFFYTVATLSTLTYGNSQFPWTAHAAGILVLTFGVSQIPLWAFVAFIKNRRLPWKEMWTQAFSPSLDWGPRDSDDKRRWLSFKEEKAKNRIQRKQPRWLQNTRIVFGLKPK